MKVIRKLMSKKAPWWGVIIEKKLSRTDLTSFCFNKIEI